MKTIYLVRHGESEGNVGPIGQTAETPLTDNGRRQAALVGDRCAKIDIDTIICSTMVRARQTADYILEKNPKPIEYSDLFIERRRPSASLGVSKDDPDAVEAENEIVEKFHLPGYRHSDEENFDDIKIRVQKAFEYLESRKEDSLLVVSHGMFLRVMAAYLVLGDKLNAEECRQFLRTMGTENTCISVFRYEKGHEWRPWQLLRWNDHAHLGELK